MRVHTDSDHYIMQQAKKKLRQGLNCQHTTTRIIVFAEQADMPLIVSPRTNICVAMPELLDFTALLDRGHAP